MFDRLQSRSGFSFRSMALFCAMVGPSATWASVHIHPPSSDPFFSQQTSIVAESIKAEAQVCATGEAEGSIGNAIQNALKIHTELAAAMPNTEELFSPIQDCFSGLLGAFDLSFAIPSLDSIRGAVKSALTKYATKKVCSAVQQARSMVTTPINQAISGLTSGTGMGGLGDLNGLSNGLIGSGLAMIDPDLGWQYATPPAGAEYTVDLNPFNSIPLDFGGSGNGNGSGGGTGTGTGGGSGATGQINSGNTQIDGLNHQIAGLQAQVGPAQQAVSRAQSALSSCQAQSYNNCSNYQAQLQQAQASLQNLNNSIASLRGQLSGSYAAPQARSSAASSSGGGGLMNRLGSLLQ